MEERSPEALRARQFTVGRRGYDRGEVDSFKAEVAAIVLAMGADIERLTGMLHQAGFDDPRDLASELQLVAADVGRILEEARSTAEGVRSRATADATRWRGEADAQAAAVIAAAGAAAELARGSAWEESTALLEAALDEHDRLLDGAGQDALYIRAEAEREALRLTADARRERDEEMRRLREEGERIMATARQEAETLIASARHQAEAAQERARALETRRTELMAELEAARASIGMLESEIETKQRVLEDVDEYEEEEAVEWPGEERSVRIVSGARAVRSHPVDALEIAAEVEELQRPRQEPPPAPAVAPQPAVLEEVVPEEPEPVVAPLPEEAAVEVEPAEMVLAPPQAEESTEEIVLVAEEPQPESGGNDLSGLFAALRDEPQSEPPALEPAVVSQEKLRPARQSKAVAPVVAAVRDVTPPRARDDELRDQLLLPIQNRALRGIKRDIVDLQNRCLEELRVEESWSPDEALFAGAFADDLDLLGRESLLAGFAAAREVAGAAETPHPAGVAFESPADEFVAALLAAVRGALERSRGAGTGARESASSLSRIFRTWRTDEAERRVRVVAEAAFDRGFRAALDSLGVTV
jgi:DivIVA domain-containing protein